jgi:CRP-like cAMP-binding protein
LNDLPLKLKTDVSLYVYKQRYESIDFFKSKDTRFIVWMSPQLKPFAFPSNDWIYLEKDQIENIYFLTKGQVALTLPSFKSTPYVKINSGNRFGVMDIVGCCQLDNIETRKWFTHKSNLKRLFSIQAIEESETLALNLDGLFHMMEEFHDCY